MAKRLRKYRWRDREKHFWYLNFLQGHRSDLIRSILFGEREVDSWNMKGVEYYVGMDKPESHDQVPFSALDIESGTTSPDTF